MYINYIIKLRRYIRKEGKKVGRKGIYNYIGIKIKDYIID
jgi:hypothetical protein